MIRTFFLSSISAFVWVDHKLKLEKMDFLSSERGMISVDVRLMFP